jgi:hypothetical protein
MSKLFLTKDKTIQYQYLCLDLENRETLNELSKILNKVVNQYTGPVSQLFTENLVFKLDKINEFDNHRDLLEYVLLESELQIKDGIEIYSLMTTDIWANPDDFEYYVGFNLRYYSK